MVDDFSEKMGAIQRDIGFGSLNGQVEVDQVYAHYQHENPQFNHPRGGQAYFLSEPLMSKHNDYLDHIADTIARGGSPLSAMIDNMENLSDQVAIHAPVEFFNLKLSGHPTVTDNGATAYDRPPVQHRLTDEELRELGKLRGGHPYGDRGKPKWKRATGQ